MPRRPKPDAMDAGDALLMGFAGFGLAYVVLVPHTDPHWVHWAWSAGSGIFGYVSWRLWKRFKRR